MKNFDLEVNEKHYVVKLISEVFENIIEKKDKYVKNFESYMKSEPF